MELLNLTPYLFAIGRVVGPEQDTAQRRIRPSAGYGPKT